MHKSQVFGYLLISFLVGVFVSGWISNPMAAVLILIMVGTIIFVGAGYERTFAKTKKAERYRRAGMIMGACVLGVALGIFRYGQVNLSESVLLKFTDVQIAGKGERVVVKGFVDNEMAISGNKGQVVLHVRELDVPGYAIKVDEPVLIYTSASPVYKIGDKILAAGILEAPKNFTDEFDYVQYLKNKEIRALLPYPKIIFDPTVNVPLFQKLKISIYRPLFALRNIFESSINRSLPEPYAAYTNGVLLGSRSAIPQDLTDAFNRTSTTHILAISGYNITIIAEAVLAVLVIFVRRRRAFWISVALIILFTIMTGAGASVVRAAIMGLLLLYANGYGRLYDPRNSILAAAAVMVWLDPLSLRFDVGFQLSFLAVLGLIYIYPILESKFKKFPKWKGLKETILMSLAAQIAVAPILAYTFHTFSLVSLPANALVLPLMPYTMLLGFLTGAAGMIFQALGQAIGVLTLALTWYQLAVIRWIAALPFAAVNITISSVLLVAIYIFIILGAITWHRQQEN